MAVLDSLDLVIFQGQTMASFRPDNVKRFPLRRVRDLCGVGVGGKWLQDKIAITHMELFGYLENRVSKDHNTTSYENILGQILSAATAAGSDGISFFTYHANIHDPGRKPSKDIARAREAVVDGLAAYNLIWEKVARGPNPVAFYYPWEDWVVERFVNSYVPAFDAFRRLGVAADFVPFSPTAKESLYPFYPYYPNEDAIARLLEKRIAIVLPDVSGFQATDSRFVQEFLERGGAVLAFGPQLPMGNTYDRDELLGASEGDKGPPEGDRCEEAGGEPDEGREPGSGWAGIRPGPAGSGGQGEGRRGIRGRLGGGASRTASGRASSPRSRWTRRPRPGTSPMSSATSSTPSMAVTGGRRAVDVLGTTENVDLASCFGPERRARRRRQSWDRAPIDVVIVPLGAKVHGGRHVDGPRDRKKSAGPARRRRHRRPHPGPGLCLLGVYKRG